MEEPPVCQTPTPSHSSGPRDASSRRLEDAEQAEDTNARVLDFEGLHLYWCCVTIDGLEYYPSFIKRSLEGRTKSKIKRPSSGIEKPLSLIKISRPGPPPSDPALTPSSWPSLTTARASLSSNSNASKAVKTSFSRWRRAYTALPRVPPFAALSSLPGVFSFVPNQSP